MIKSYCGKAWLSEVGWELQNRASRERPLAQQEVERHGVVEWPFGDSPGSRRSLCRRRRFPDYQSGGGGRVDARF